MKEYETLYLLSPEIPTDKAEDLNKNLSDVIQNQGDMCSPLLTGANVAWLIGSPRTRMAFMSI